MSKEKSRLEKGPIKMKKLTQINVLMSKYPITKYFLQEQQYQKRKGQRHQRSCTGGKKITKGKSNYDKNKFSFIPVPHNTWLTRTKNEIIQNAETKVTVGDSGTLTVTKLEYWHRS